MEGQSLALSRSRSRRFLMKTETLEADTDTGANCCWLILNANRRYITKQITCHAHASTSGSREVLEVSLQIAQMEDVA